LFRNILNTLGTKFLSAVISLLIVILASHLLGAEALGTIGLIILGITIILLVSNFIGGSALIYLAPRINAYNLLVISYVWSFISGILVTSILYLFNLIPREYTLHILSLSVINSLASVNLNLLLGKEKIKTFNFVTLLQIVIQFLIFAFLVLLINNRNILSYLLSLYFGFGSGFIISLIFILPVLYDVRSMKYEVKNTSNVIKEILKYGSFAQFSNIIQLLNYRLNYYLINFYFSKALLGIFSLGVQLSEGLWLISKSIATVQYARISNSTDEAYSKQLTIKFLKISFLATLICLIPLVLLPVSFYRFIFGNEFGNVRYVIMFMSFGIIAVAVNSMLSHFFSGTGRPYINTIGSSIGFILTLSLGLILIPRYGIYGAAITASLSYLASLIFQFIAFTNITKTTFSEYFIRKSDFRFIKDELSKYLSAK
jgi:O-antigen/teichoic acid export membrane protein